MTAQEDIKKIAEQIRRDYDPEKIILFGSFVWGEPNLDSDIDLFIIKETDNTRKTAMDIDGSIFPRKFPIDILVYDPKQVEKRKSNFFIKNILDNGKILYARK